MYRLWPLSRGDLYRATLSVTRVLGICGILRRTAPFSLLVRQARDTEDLFYPGSQWKTES